MPRKLPPLNALRAFEAAGRHQSFSRAARELGVSHSAISRHVRGLEHRLKVRLFRDLPRGVELSNDGQVYLAKLTPVFDAIAEASDALEERPVGVITINCEPVFAIKWLIPALGQFKSRHPEVKIRLEASSELADVTRYATDVAIRFFNSGVPDRPAELISDAAVFPYASPDLIAEPVDAAARLLGYPLLKDRSSDTWGRWFALAGVDRPDKPDKPGEGSNAVWRMDALLALESAIAGQGVILCSSEVAKRDVAAGRLIRVCDLGFREGGYYLVLAQGAARRKAVRVFQDWILDQSQALRTG